MNEEDSSSPSELHPPQWVREMQGYSVDKLQGFLGIDGIEECREAVDKLHDAKILRAISNNAKIEEQNEEERDDAWDKHHLESYTYRFHYVGILQYRQSLLYVLPKYCCNINATAEKSEEHPHWNTFQQVLQVIARYKDTKRELGEDENPLPWEDSLHVMVELVMDYVENGVYRDDEHVDEINGKGRILWQRTIQKTLPFIQDGEPIYMELHTRRKQEDEENFFTRMHHYLAHHAWEALHTVGLDSLLSLPDIPAPEDSDSDFTGRDDYLLGRIHTELSQQFDSRRRYLLQLMERYLNGKEETFSDGFHTFGKTGFHTVWEEACRVAFGMEKSTPEQMEASRPCWDFGIKGTHYGSALEADMLKVDNNKQAFTIYDAKYYIPPKDGAAKDIVEKMPGGHDVIKQQLYELALKNRYPEHKITKNVFILPMMEGDDSGDGVSVGTVRVPMLEKLGLAPVEICKVKPDTIWNAYLNRYTIKDIPK